jgi:hypothetical protein
LADRLAETLNGDSAEIVYSWRPGSEYDISAGDTAHFVYKLDTTKFWQSSNFAENRDFSLAVSLDASPGFYWTDDSGINATTRSTLGIGLPVSASFTVRKP